MCNSVLTHSSFVARLLGAGQPVSDHNYEAATTYKPVCHLQRLSSSPRRGNRHDQQESGGESTLADVLRILEADAFEAGRLAAPLLAAAGPALPASLRGHLATLEQRVLEVRPCNLGPRPACQLPTQGPGLCRAAWPQHASVKRSVGGTPGRVRTCCVHAVCASANGAPCRPFTCDCTKTCALTDHRPPSPSRL